MPGTRPSPASDERARVRITALEEAKAAAVEAAEKHANATPKERFYAVAAAAQRRAAEASHRERDLVDDLITEIADEAADPWRPKG